MTDISPHALTNVPYQGNVWWAFLGLGSLFLLCRILLGLRRRRKAGLPSVDARGIIVICIVFLGAFALAVFQVLSHQ